MKNIKKLVLASMFLAIGHILPFFTGQIPQIGKMLLPMHIPVLLCGLVCGWQYGLAVGFVLPIMRSMIFGMPIMFPDAVAMAFELAAYGSIVGYLFEHARWQCVVSLYRCMLAAMLCGRMVWGIVRMFCMGHGADLRGARRGEAALSGGYPREDRPGSGVCRLRRCGGDQAQALPAGGRLRHGPPAGYRCDPAGWGKDFPDGNRPAAKKVPAVRP